MPLKNYTTSVPADRSLGEIVTRLSRHGAKEITTEYEQGEPVGLRFAIDTKHGRQQFRLPARWEAVHRVLRSEYGSGGNVERRHTSADHARRVAWRLLRDWVDVQIALVEVGMASVDEIMLPYLVLPDSTLTLYQAIVERGVPQFADPEADGILLLPAPRVG